MHVQVDDASASVLLREIKNKKNVKLFNLDE